METNHNPEPKEEDTNQDHNNQENSYHEISNNINTNDTNTNNNNNPVVNEQADNPSLDKTYSDNDQFYDNESFSASAFQNYKQRSTSGNEKDKVKKLSIVTFNNQPSPKQNHRASKFITDNSKLSCVYNDVVNETQTENDEKLQEKVRKSILKVISQDSPSRKNLSMKNKYITINSLLKSSIVKFPIKSNPVLNAISNHPSLQELYLSTYKGSLIRSEYSSVSQKVDDVAKELQVLKKKLELTKQERSEANSQIFTKTLHGCQEYTFKSNEEAEVGYEKMNKRTKDNYSLDLFYSKFVKGKQNSSGKNSYLKIIKDEIRGVRFKNLLDDTVRSLYPLTSGDKKKSYDLTSSVVSQHFTRKLIDDLSFTSKSSIFRKVKL